MSDSLGSRLVNELRRSMQLSPTTVTPPQQIISCWRLGQQVTGGRWYNIYRAASKTLSPQANHDFVIKLINPHLNREQTSLAVDRLGREAQSTEQIVHPNVIRLLDAELDQAPFFLVQPWIYGRSLDRLFSRAPHLPLSRMLWVMRQIAEGVRAGHEKGRVYLGLDPSHVLIGKTGRVSLTGWSQSHSFKDKVHVRQGNLQLARYTAPECFSPEYRADPASDVYSLGTLIYHALCIQPPFDGQTVEEIEDAHLNHIPEDLRFSQPDCPLRLGQLAKQMIAKNPLMRPSLREVLNELIAIEIEHLSDATPILF